MSTAPPSVRAGTSLPTSAAISQSLLFGRCNSHISFSPLSTAAASAEPAPSPAPAGIRFTILIAAPRLHPVARRNASAAFQARFFYCGRSARPLSRQGESASNATITSHARSRDVLLVVLFIPVLFPLLYSCVAATTAALGGTIDLGGAFGIGVVGAFGYDIIFTAIAWLLYDYVVG